MEQKIINPWTWQERAGFSQAIETTNCRPASTLLGIERLAYPELMIEIEATAVK
jgi:enamine deaminase RidA (YjgF/YER057c/UK114 family)